MIKRLEAVSRGDFTVDVDIIETRDELGQLSKTLGLMVSEISVLLQIIQKNTDDNLEMAGSLSSLSIQMSENAASSRQKTNVATSSAKATNANMVMVATAMEQASANINGIASAIEENTIALKDLRKIILLIILYVNQKNKTFEGR